MLPDYPSLKKDIEEVLHVFFRRRVDQHAIAVKQMPKMRMFEGKGTIVKRASGEDDPTAFMRAETIFELQLDDIPKMSVNDVLNKLDNAAQDMAGKMETGLFKSLSEDLGKRERTVDHKGQPLSGKVILETLRNLFIPFDHTGNPQMPSIFMGPNLKESMERALKEIDENPLLKKEYDEIIQLKREEWRAEEASRKLVG
jgi:hypothetical protein